MQKVLQHLAEVFNSGWALNIRLGLFFRNASGRDKSHRHLAARQLELCVVQKLNAVKRDGKVVDLDVARHRVNAQHAGAGAGLRGETGLLLQPSA
jgi:hypothetical protein